LSRQGVDDVVAFTNILLEDGLLTPRDLKRAEHVCTKAGGRLAATLTRLGMVREEDVADALARAHGLERVGRSALSCPADLFARCNPDFLRRRSALPLDLDADRLLVALADPGDEEAASGLAFALAMERTEAVVATRSDIDDALLAATPLAADEEEVGPSGSADDLERMIDGESEAPVIRLVQRLLAGAVDRRASDVHIEPLARAVSVRYRIDGRLIEVERLPDTLAGPIASRIKVMAGLDIAESRLPQDGRLRLTVRGGDVDVRVATSPVAHGESLVLRLLGRASVPLELDALGLPPRALAALAEALERPHGIVLVTGPTGSGKTTTLYAAINRLRRPEVKILTVEDPVEVLIEGVNQVQVRPEIDLGYAKALRAFLRQDPDILMIGEIRDGETAEIALRAALTGHLVLSTLHTNSALGAFVRLSDLGMEPYLVASTVVAAVAQRLIRSLCDCAAPRAPDAGERALFARHGLAPPECLHEPVGCPRCRGTGYAGRIPLIEVVPVDDALRGLIREGRAEAHAAAQPAGETLLGHGLALAAQGRTSLPELFRAVESA
jgi:general secretion pathway protein E